MRARCARIFATTWSLSLLVGVLVAIPFAFLELDGPRELLLASPAGRAAVLIVLIAFGALVGASTGRLVDGLRRQVVTDSLTGLYNRRFMDTQLELLDAKASRYGRRYAVLAFDLDGLKAINDRHGHGVGDMAICTFAAILRRALRRSDVAIRTGGDEFIAILPETPASGVHIVYERVRTSLAAAREADPRLALTVSAGAVGWRDGRAVSALVQDADRLLYDAKRSGKDRLEVELSGA